MPVWNRPNELSETLQCLNIQRGLREWTLFIQIDPSSKLSEILIQIEKSELSCKINIECNAKILGVRGNTFHCLQRAAQHGAKLFFYLEDDLELSGDALEFIELAMAMPNFSQNFVAGNLHFSGCSNHAHLAIPKQVNPIWPHLAIKSKFLSSYGLFFSIEQFEQFISPHWWTHPLKVRDLRGNRGAGWDYSLTEALLEKQKFCLQSLLPRVRHNGPIGVHCTPLEYEQGWNNAELWPGVETLSTIQEVKVNDSLLGELTSFVTMASQCWSLQYRWLLQDRNLSKIAQGLRKQVL